MEKALLSLEIARGSGEELGEVKALQEMETRHEVQEKEREIGII